jgi:hypothetical protein
MRRGEEHGMWIELHDTMPGHWKTEGLAKELEINQAHAAGILCCLWTWALNNAPDGDLARLSEEKLARECYWTLGRPLLPALKACGFVDGDDKIHDWSDYTGRLMEKREANARRMRLARARQRQAALDALALEEAAVLRGEPQARAAHVREPCGATVPNPTLQDPTEPDPTEEDPPVFPAHTALRAPSLPDDAWKYSARARAAVAQRVTNALVRQGCHGKNLYDVVLDLLQSGLPPHAMMVCRGLSDREVNLKLLPIWYHDYVKTGKVPRLQEP